MVAFQVKETVAGAFREFLWVISPCLRIYPTTPFLISAYPYTTLAVFAYSQDSGGETLFEVPDQFPVFGFQIESVAIGANPSQFPGIA